MFFFCLSRLLGTLSLRYTGVECIRSPPVLPSSLSTPCHLTLDDGLEQKFPRHRNLPCSVVGAPFTTIAVPNPDALSSTPRGVCMYVQPNTAYVVTPCDVVGRGSRGRSGGAGRHGPQRAGAGVLLQRADGRGRGGGGGVRGQKSPVP